MGTKQLDIYSRKICVGIFFSSHVDRQTQRQDSFSYINRKTQRGNHFYSTGRSERERGRGSSTGPPSV
ncbi:hypothetical protein QVD17_05991 [Tagetes erecta]|uniref:Uncharacterized protein n=1 Tax=Tagetes erecta TaxID=13708 RepID=A0AAD8LJB4_TARER|nr:hypothetical protein QVD17_05991 [Tagetes erecta]